MGKGKCIEQHHKCNGKVDILYHVWYVNLNEKEMQSFLCVQDGNIKGRFFTS